MTKLCKYFPGADTPIDYDNYSSEDMMDDVDSQEDDTLDQYTYDDMSQPYPGMDTQLSTQSEPMPVSPVSRRTNVRSQIRPHSFVGTQINRLQSNILPSAHSRPISIAAIPQPKHPSIGINVNRIGQIQIPPQFQNNLSPRQSSVNAGSQSNAQKAHAKRHFKSNNGAMNVTSPTEVDANVKNTTIDRLSPNAPPSQVSSNFLSINRSPISQIRSGGSTPLSVMSSSQDSRLMNRSPNFFSDTNSPRRSPMMNYNVGNMNPRHVDIESYWKQESESSNKSSLRNTLSPNVNNSFNSQNQDVWNSIPTDRNQGSYVPSPNGSGVTNSGYLNGNLREPGRGGFLAVPDPRLTMPLNIDVDPVSILSYSTILRRKIQISRNFN